MPFPVVRALSEFAKHIGVPKCALRWKPADDAFDIAQRLVDRRSGDRSRFDGAISNPEGSKLQPQSITQQPESGFAGGQNSAKRNCDVCSNRADIHNTDRKSVV